ncbi:MAG: prepilin-type N-terminal cleavage/methylation domain-containing protein [Candidatus Omnitrophica bacterium]|nr:prepilin-type N-terminal cleavage/methylation domain-containing protein [Candidatus Omnitrophota bacterium]
MGIKLFFGCSRGMTLMEVLVAMILISILSLEVSTAVVYERKFSHAIEHKVMALNLAQSAAEKLIILAEEYVNGTISSTENALKVGTHENISTAEWYTPGICELPSVWMKEELEGTIEYKVTDLDHGSDLHSLKVELKVKWKEKLMNDLEKELELDFLACTYYV